MAKDVYKNAEKNLKKLHAGKLGRIAKLKRTAKELIMGEKTYLPKSAGAKRGKKQIDKQRYETRKKQAEVKKQIEASDKAFKKREPMRRRLGIS
jgi:hypothetical protein